MNKKRIGLLLLLFFALLPVTAQAKVKAPKKECHAYVVMDAGSGKVLFGQDANKKIYPASTAKLMNAIVCVENGDLDSVIKTKSEVVYNTTPGTYSLGIGAGVKYTFQDLLHMSLMASAADATDSLAVGVFGSKKACVKAMNEKCKELGLTKTSFDNPVGSDIGAGYNKTYSTATEMAKICRYAMAVPAIRNVVKKAHYDTEKGGVSVNTTNWFLRGLAYYDSDSYKIIGSKSGTTNAAGNVFIATAMDDEGHELICAYFGNVSKESTFSSIRSLLDYAFKKYRSGKITLSQSNYDVRISEKYGEAYEEYASLNCYPSDGDGTFSPNTAITRTELAAMLEKTAGLEDNGILKAFVSENESGKVTALRLARLLFKLYPSALSGDEQVETLALSSAIGLADANEEEEEAFAAFIANGFAVDDSCQNAGQIITRGQALLIADRLSDYEMNYAAAHGQSSQYCESGQVTMASDESDSAAKTVTQSTGTGQTAAATTQAATTESTAQGTAQAAGQSTTTSGQDTGTQSAGQTGTQDSVQTSAEKEQDAAAEETTEDAALRAKQDAARARLEAQNFPVITFNKKWSDILTKQKEERLEKQKEAERKKKKAEKKRQKELKKQQEAAKKKQKEEEKKKKEEQKKQKEQKEQEETTEEKQEQKTAA